MRRLALVLVALTSLACRKDRPPPEASTRASVAGEDGAAPPAADAAPPAADSGVVDAAAGSPDASLPPGLVDYDDVLDLPADAGATGRCDGGAPAKEVAVRLELVDRGRAVDLVVPSKKLRKRVSWPDPEEPISCDAKREASGEAMRFRCTVDIGFVSGKVYVRGDDLVVGASGTRDGNTVERIALPCGARVRFEPVACRAPCRVEEPGGCGCSTWYTTPGAAPTSTR